VGIVTRAGTPAPWRTEGPDGIRISTDG